MKIIGRRFWTWMSLWTLTFFVKGDLHAAPQEKGTTQATEGTSYTRHKLPLLKTQSSKAGVFPKSQSSLKTQSGPVFPKSQSSLKAQSGLKTESIPGVGKIAKTEFYRTNQDDKTSPNSKTAGVKTHTHKVHK